MKKKLLSLLLALAMVLSMVPTGLATASSAEEWTMSSAGRRSEDMTQAEYEATLVYSAQPRMVGNELGIPVDGPMPDLSFQLTPYYYATTPIRGEGRPSTWLPYLWTYISHRNPSVSKLSGTYRMNYDGRHVYSEWWSAITSRANGEGIYLKLEAEIFNIMYAEVGGARLYQNGMGWREHHEDTTTEMSDLTFSFESRENHNDEYGDNQYISGVKIFLKDDVAPAVKSATVKDNYVTLTFGEPIRRLWRDVQAAADYKVIFVTDDDTEIEARIVGFSKDCKQMVVYPDMSGAYADGRDVNIKTVKFNVSPSTKTEYNFYTNQSNSLNLGLYSRGSGTRVTAYSDYAGNDLQTTDMAFTLRGASPVVTEIDMDGSMITEKTPADAESEGWPADADRNSVFAGVGDSMDFTMSVERKDGRGAELYAHNTATDAQPGYLELNVKDAEGNPVRLATTTVVNRSQQANADATGLINFETFVVEEGMTLTDTTGYVHPVQYVGSNDIYDVTGLPVESQDVTHINVAKKIYLDTAAPETIMVMDTTDEGYLSVTTTTQDKAIENGIAAEMMDTQARFALYGDTYAGQKPTPIQYQYSVDNGETWITAKLDATAAQSDNFPLNMPTTTNTNTLLFQFPDTDGLVLQNLKLDVKAQDIAGTVGTTTLDLSSYHFDRCAPIISMVSSGVSYDTQMGTFTGTYEITDHVEAGLTATYQWDEEPVQSAAVQGTTFTITDSEDASADTTKVLKITVTDAARNETQYTQSVTYNMSKAQSVYRLGDLSAPSAIPAVTVGSPDAMGNDIATTRVTVIAGADTYVRMFSSDYVLAPDTVLMDFNGDWDEVTVDSDTNTYTTVEEGDFATYYGPVDVSIATAYTDLTPVVGGALVPDVSTGYNDRGHIATAYYAPNVADIYSISDIQTLDAQGEAVPYQEEAVLASIQDYMVTFTVTNHRIPDWGMGDVDFDRSVVTLYNTQGQPIWTSKLSNNLTQRIVLPALDYPTGSYSMDVNLYSKAGSHIEKTLFEELVIDNVAVTGGGLWEYSVATDNNGPSYNLEKYGHAYEETTYVRSYDANKPLGYIGVYELIKDYGDDMVTTDTTLEYVGADGGVTTAQKDGSNIPENIVWSQMFTGASSGRNILTFRVNDPATVYNGMAVGTGLALYLFNQDKSYTASYDATYREYEIDDNGVCTIEVSASRIIDDWKDAVGDLAESQIIYYQFGLANGQRSQVRQFTLAYRQDPSPVSASLTFTNVLMEDVGDEEMLGSVDVGIENITSSNSAVTVYHATFNDDTLYYDLEPYTGPITCNYEDFPVGNFVSGNGNLSCSIYWGDTHLTARHMFIVVDEWGGVAYYVPHLERGYSPSGYTGLDTHESGAGPYGAYQFAFIPYFQRLEDSLDFQREDLLPTAEDSQAVTILATDGDYSNIDINASQLTWNEGTAHWVQDGVRPNGTGIVGGGQIVTYEYSFIGDYGTYNGEQLYYQYYSDRELAPNEIPDGYKFCYVSSSPGRPDSYIYEFANQYIYSDTKYPEDEIPTDYAYDSSSSYNYLKLANPIGMDGAVFDYQPTINAVGQAGDTKDIVPEMEDEIYYRSDLLDTTRGNGDDSTQDTVYFHTYLQSINGDMDYKYRLPTDCNVEAFPDLTFTDAFGNNQLVSGLSLDAPGKPTVVISSMEPNTPVTLTITYDKPVYLEGLTREVYGTDADGNPVLEETVNIVEPEDIQGDGTQEVIVTLRQNATLHFTDGKVDGTRYGSFTVKTINAEVLEEEKGQNIEDATLECFDEDGNLVDMTQTATLYTTITAKIYTMNNGEKEYLLDSEGQELTYCFDPLENDFVTSYTFEAGTYFDKYGATGDADVAVNLGNITLKVRDNTAPTVQFTGQVGITGQNQVVQAVYTAVPVAPESDHPTLANPAGYTLCATPADLVTALGWGTTYTLNYKVADKQSAKTQTYLKNGVVDALTDQTSDTIPGVTFHAALRTVTVAADATFTLVTVDPNGNATFTPFVFTLTPAPVPTVVITNPAFGMARVTLQAPAGVSNLKIINAGAATDGTYMDYTENVENAIVSYSFTYNGFDCTGGVMVTVTGVPGRFGWLSTEFPRNYYDTVTGQTMTIAMKFSQPIEKIGADNLNPAVTASAIDDTVRFWITANTPAINGIKITDIYGQTAYVNLDAITNMDTTPPVVDITSKLLASGVYEYTFISNEIVSFTENGQGGRTTFTRKIPANGEYTFNFIDLAGNVATYPVTVDGYPDAPLALTYAKSEAGTYTDSLGAIQVGDTFYIKANQTCTVNFNGETYAMTAHTPRMLTMYGSGAIAPSIEAVNPFNHRVYHAFREVTIPDTTAPQIVIRDNKFSVSLPAADLEALLLDNIIVADNKDRVEDLTITVEYPETLVTGNNLVTYTATDTAGNAAALDFALRVFGEDSAVVYVNGAVVSREAILLMERGSHDIKVMMPVTDGQIEPYSLSIKAGRKTAAQMKRDATVLLNQTHENTTTTIQLDTIGYYTVLVQSQGRDSYLFTLFIQ